VEGFSTLAAIPRICRDGKDKTNAVLLVRENLRWTVAIKKTDLIAAIVEGDEIGAPLYIASFYHW
jgi:hypothetical protein